jgi:tetratricopeptide (TPR) repeat protein
MNNARPVFDSGRISDVLLGGRRWAWVGLGVGLAVAGVVVAMPGVSWWRARQVAALTELALKYGQKQMSREAMMSVETALRLDPLDLGALRALAQLQSTQSGAAALAVYGTLRGVGGLTEEDARRYVRLAADQAQWSLAEELISVATTDGSAATPFILQAELREAQGDRDGALAAWRQAMASDPGDEARAGLWRLLVKSRTGAESSSGEMGDLLRELVTRPHRHGAEALATGLELGLAEEPELRVWAERLRDHSQATPGQRLLAEEAAMRLDPSVRPQVLARVAASLRTQAPAERLMAMRWLLRLGAAEEAAQGMTRDEAMRQSDTFLIWLEAVALTGRWDDVLAAMAEPAQPLDDSLKLVWRGRAWRAQGRNAEADGAFRTALQRAVAVSPEVVVFLRRIGEAPLLEAHWASQFADPARAGEALVAVESVLRSHGDAALIGWMYDVAAASPVLSQQFEVMNEQAYWHLILREPVSLDSVAQRVSDHPLDLRCRLTLALALVRGGQGEEARRLLENFLPDPLSSGLSARERSVTIHVLAAAGDMTAARAVAATVPARALTQQENALLQRVLSLADPAAVPPVGR